MKVPKADIGLIGGTGAYDPKILENVKEIKISTDYGSPSDSIILGELNGKKIAILPRHGKNHTIPPHKINFKANIAALKELGVTRILATAAAGSLKENYKAGEVVIPDQFIDFGRDVHTFYDEKPFYHVSMAEPFCPELRSFLIDSAKGLGVAYHDRGVYVRVSGPQFSTKAASQMYRNFGDLIGMTCVPEAILAKEKEMCFGVLTTITDYDVWAEKPVNFEEIKKIMAKNLETTKKILEMVINKIPEKRGCECNQALKHAKA